MSESEAPTQPKRVRVSDDDLNSMTKQDLVSRLKELDSYVDFLEERQQLSENGDETEDLKGKLDVARRKENTLVSKLTRKEQEVQENANKVQELKLKVLSDYQTSSNELQTMQLDPAINLIFGAMQKEIDSLKEKLELSQTEMSAWKFTPDSQTGKKLISKCRQLHQENEDLGKVISSGKLSKLESEIALEKALVQEMKKGQSDLDEFLGEIDEDVEGMQGMVYVLQQQLKDTKQQLDQAMDHIAELNPNDNFLKEQLTKENDEEKVNSLKVGHLSATENHISDSCDRTEELSNDTLVKEEPMDVDSEDHWTSRTSENINNAHSPITSNSSIDQTSPKVNPINHRTAENRTTAHKNASDTKTDVSANRDSKVRRLDQVKDTKHEPTSTQNGIRKGRAASLDALDE